MDARDIYGCASSYKEDKMFYNLVTWFTCLSLIIPVIPHERVTQVDEPHIMTLSEEEIFPDSDESEQNKFEQAVKDMQLDMDQIEDITSSTMDWYIAYKNVIDKYTEIIDPPETVYDYFTDDEIYLIQRTVETECYDQDFDSKCNVASVIFNRIEDENKRFGDSVYEVITTPNQFSYSRKNISENTILAVEYSFEILDTTHGCIGFHSNKKTKTFNGWKYSFTDNIGHHFYKEENNGQ